MLSIMLSDMTSLLCPDCDTTSSTKLRPIYAAVFYKLVSLPGCYNAIQCMLRLISYVINNMLPPEHNLISLVSLENDLTLW